MTNPMSFVDFEDRLFAAKENLRKAKTAVVLRNRTQKVLDGTARIGLIINTSGKKHINLLAEGATAYWEFTARHLSDIRFLRLQIKAIEQQLRRESN